MDVAIAVKGFKTLNPGTLRVVAEKTVQLAMRCGICETIEAVITLHEHPRERV